MSDPQTPPSKPIRLWRRVMLGVVGLVVLIALLGVIGNRYDHARTVGALKALTDRLDEDDPHWRLADIEANRDVIPDDENSARVVVRISAALPGHWDMKEDPDSIPPPEEQLGATMRASIEAGLKEVSDLLPEARRLADMPRGRFPLRYADNPLETVPFDIAEARLVVLLLRYDSLLLAQKGDIDGALRSARALINSARAVGDEPLADSQVMRMGRVVVGCAAIERALAQGVASEKELAAVQHLLELEAQHPTEQIVARGVRATRFDFYEKALGGKQSMATVNPYFASSNLSWWEQVFGRRVSRRDQIADLRLTTKYVESTRLPNHEQAAVQLRLDEEMSQLAKESNGALIHFDSTMDPSLGRGKKALVRCMMATVAVERFRLATGKWPASLEQLRPKYLVEVPFDPNEGKPLEYEKTTDGAIIACVGQVEIGGDAKVVIGPTAPMYYRLWDVDKRRQPAKPRPIAPKEEIPP